MKLTTGATYDMDTLTFTRWMAGDSRASDADTQGYVVADYFDGRGCYLGPDVDGIEPDFSFAEELGEA